MRHHQVNKKLTIKYYLRYPIRITVFLTSVHRNQDQKRTLYYNLMIFSRTILGVIPQWICELKNNHITRNTVKKATKYKFLLKSDAISGSTSRGVQLPVLFSFCLDKHPEFKVFSQQEKNIRKS